jgi:hypothetical protein
MSQATALKASIAVVTAFAACVCAAQQASDANAAGMSPPPATSASGTVDAQHGVYPDAARPYETRRPMLAACAGLADRQTERACKDRRSDDANMSLKGNDSGNIEDQAD